MRCAKHSDAIAAGRCQMCGKLFCRECLGPGRRRPACEACRESRPRRRRRGIPVWALLLIPLVLARPVSGCVTHHRRAAKERAPLARLRAIDAAQRKFRQMDYDGDRCLDYARSFGELRAAGLIDKESGRDYRFGLSGSTFEWLATATPARPGDGDRNFLICYRGVVHFATGNRAFCDCACMQ